MDLLENLGMSLLNFNFVMIYVIHKILVLLKNHLNYFKSSIYECFSKTLIDFYLFYRKAISSTIYNVGKSNVWKRKHK